MTADDMESADPRFRIDVERAVMSLPAARLLGVRIVRLAPGEAHLELAFRAELSSRGVFQGGIIGALADFAGGAAAATLLPPHGSNVTADYTVKLLAPASGEKLAACGKVLRAGKATSVASVEIYVLHGETRTLCATALVGMRNF